MENLSLLDRFSNPETLEAMSLGEKLLASTYVAVLGMMITFVVLIIIWGLIILMGEVFNIKKPKKKAIEEIDIQAKADSKEAEKEDTEELIAVITAAIAGSLNTSTHNIIVRNIVRIPDGTPAWSRAGRIEQMNKML